MLDGTIIRGFENHDRAINALNQRFNELQKGYDKVYMQNLTHVMMWDALIGLLESKGSITSKEFDRALQALHEKTKAAMVVEQAKAAQEKAEEGYTKIPVEGKTTVLSDQPAIPVIK